MGAAPSRETIEHTLPQPPFYGQRQQIVLVPLLKKFFPSADCPLFVQLYEARCDPAVRYYYYADDGVKDVSHATPAPPAQEACGDDTSSLSLAERVGGVPFHCPPMEVFPSVSFSREEMYDAYVTQGGERLVYNTDAEMLQAYRADPTSVRPLPCAVAFLYRRSAQGVPAGVENTGDGAAESGEPTAAAESKRSTLRAAPHTIPEDCSEVLGCYVKATGFVGDVQCLGRHRHRRGTERLNYEMQMFLTKSAGDHNRTHVLLSAIYTYAEQWQRACLHCVPHDLVGEHAPPEAHGEASAQGKEELDVVPSFYKPFTQTHEMLVEASRAGGHYPDLPHGVEGEGAATNTAAGHEAAAKDASTRAGARAHTPDQQQAKARYWAPPPLSALVLRSRRANVPLLCFLRETRACIANMFLFHVKYYYHEHQKEQQDMESTEEMVAAAAVGGNIGVQPTLHPDMLPPGCWHMWMQDTLTLSDASGEDNYESVLNVHCTERFMQSIVEYVVACLLHNLNPLEAFRSQPSREAVASGNNNMIATSCSTPRADATGDRASSPAVEGESSAAPTTTGAVEEAVRGKGARVGVEAVATTTAAVIPHSLSLFRLPDEGMLVVTWPPRPIDETAALPSTGVAADILSQWKHLYSTHYLFWVIGPSVENRRSATVAMLNWVQAKKGPVIWGYHLDEHDREISSTPLERHRNSIVYAVYPSSSMEDYLCTVKINGVGEEMLLGDTVLCLMPVTGGESTEERVLRVCRLPLEELLLGELRNASKLAREASPVDPRWVRQKLTARGTYKGCVLRAPTLAEGDTETTVVISNGVELPAVPPEADGIVGDGTSCLWRVDLLERYYRVIAVTPQFLKPLRKKHSKKKKLLSKAAVAQGTATQVFLAAPHANVGPADGAGEQMRGTAKETEQWAEAVSAATTSAPKQAGSLAPVLFEGEKVEAHHGIAEAATAAGATAISSPTVVPTNQKKKAKKAAAAAVACMESSTEVAAEAPSNAVTTHESKEAHESANGKARPPAITPPPELHEDSKPDASGGQKTAKTAALPMGASSTETTATAPATESATHASKPQPTVVPSRPLPAGEIDPNAIYNIIKGSKNWGRLQRTPVTSTRTSSVATPTLSYAESGSWGCGAGHAQPAAYPPGYGAHGRGPPSYDAHAYPLQLPLPLPIPGSAAAAVVTGGYAMPHYGANYACAQVGSAAAAPPPPPPCCAHSGGGHAPPDYENCYPQGSGLAEKRFGLSYDQMPHGGATAAVDGEAPERCELNEGVMCVAGKLQKELATLTTLEEAEAKAMTFTELKGRGAHPGQEAFSSHRITHLPLPRRANFGMETSPTVPLPHATAASASSLDSPAARWLGHNISPPLPLSEAVISSQMPSTSHPDSGSANKVGSPELYSPQHAQSAEDPNSTLLITGGSRLRIQLGDFVSPVVNNGNAPAVPIGHHTRYASSPYQQQISAFEDVGAMSNPGDGPAGSSVNVHVRVRHHHHTHSPATSFFSDSTGDHGNSHPHHTHGSHAQGEAGTSILHPSQSFASMGSLSIVFQGAGGAPGSNPAGSIREPQNSGMGGDHSTHSHPYRTHVLGAASSTRSGETTSTARLTNKRCGTYRWDWRTVSLDIGEED
ncbi:hypothetical protein ABL78_3528 [Leptomonas seymouri]|uniref:Uncharacterized protein n=1 Tax=Leptomonas seymouri TaxID=5684 RepID=A0A0N1HXT7_LEPSE|nr:hypothetical protein ABL78_3528 [Leptomonas seymouri]|eukprot:KPI87394.1 hypothetical protein ABL78_3528 [Leptomonas seymouri]